MFIYIHEKNTGRPCLVNVANVVAIEKYDSYLRIQTTNELFYDTTDTDFIYKLTDEKNLM